MNSRDKSFFTKQLMQWNATANGRKMPWKGEKNPYRIWLSEIILQQTRVEQGWEYYNRFIKNYPTIQKLAAAPETEIFKLWEGLGYYSRCKNVIATAKYIAGELNGRFPDQYEDILSLKGVGPYTAAAIASFAYALPHAVLDGNVYRVLSRYFGISIPVDSGEGKKYFTALATSLLDKSAPGIYNQAIMDLGATICKPAPQCMECPLRKKCVAFNTDTVSDFPVKEKKLVRKTRWFYYIIAEYGNDILVRKRDKDIWQNLHEFILIESDREMSMEEIYRSTLFKKLGVSRIPDISDVYQQHLTHQTIKGQFIYVQLKKPVSLNGYIALDRAALHQLAFPRYINAYLAESRILQL